MSAATSGPTLLDSWQAALGSEHAAVYGYGLIGPHLSDPTQIAEARAIQQGHRERRDTLTSSLAAGGAVPAVADPAYRPAEPVTDAASAQRLALLLEQRCGQSYRFVLSRSAAQSASPSPSGGSASSGPTSAGSTTAGGNETADARRRALAGLAATALAAATWRALVQPGAASVAFPGQ